MAAGGVDEAQLKPPHLTTKATVIEALEPLAPPESPAPVDAGTVP